MGLPPELSGHPSWNDGSEPVRSLIRKKDEGWTDSSDPRKNAEGEKNKDNKSGKKIGQNETRLRPAT